MAKKRKQSRVFVSVAVLMIIIGTLMMLSLMTGGRISVAAAPTLVAGFATIAVGCMLLTESAIAVFFYFLYALSIAAIQMIEHGILSIHSAGSAVLILIGIFLAKHLSKRSR